MSIYHQKSSVSSSSLDFGPWTTWWCMLTFARRGWCRLECRLETAHHRSCAQCRARLEIWVSNLGRIWQPVHSSENPTAGTVQNADWAFGYLSDVMFFLNVFLTIPKVYEIGIDWDCPWCSHMTGTYCWCLLWPPGPWSVMLGATQAEPAAYPTTRSKCIACMQQLRLRCRVFVATIFGVKNATTIIWIEEIICWSYPHVHW